MSKIKTVLVVVIGLVALIGIWYGVNQQNQKADQTKVIKIGALYGLSGDYAEYSKGIGKGIEYAVKDFQGEHLDTKIELVIEDDKSCDKVAGVTGIQKLINIDGVKAVTGVLCSGSVIVTAPIAEQNKILFMSGSASTKEISALGDYVFRTYPSDQQRIKKIADLIKERNYQKVDFVYELESDAALTGTTDMINYLGDSVSTKSYKISAKDMDFGTIIAQMKQDNPDVVVFALMNANQIAILAKQIQEMGLQVPLFTPYETVQDNKVIDFFGKTELIYAIFTPDETNSQYIELKSRYRNDTGATEAEVPQYLAENYDGTMIVLQALYEAKGDTKKAQKLMYQIGNNYQGKSGTITFDANGDISKMPALMTIKDGKFVKYEK